MTNSIEESKLLKNKNFVPSVKFIHQKGNFREKQMHTWKIEYYVWKTNILELDGNLKEFYENYSKENKGKISESHKEEMKKAEE